MKTLLCTIILVAIRLCATAQGDQYTFSTISDSYGILNGGSPFLSNQFSDTIALGFKFTLAGIAGDKLYVNLRGSISTAGGGINDVKMETFYSDHSGGQYTYAISGDAGSRIVKLQFANVRFDNEVSKTSYMHYQVWLHEADNSVELHYGYNKINRADSCFPYTGGGPVIGMRHLWLKGSPASPVADTAASNHLSGAPEDGRIYYFTPSTVSVHDAAHSINKHISVYPNPAIDNVYIRTGGIITDIRLTDVSGKIITERKQAPDGAALDMSRLPAGIYLLYAGGEVIRISK